MAKLLTLHVGINNFPGGDNDLAGCVNDAHDMAQLFAPVATSQTFLLDKRATRSRSLQAMLDLLHSLKAGDFGVITWSGHGTYVPDKNGDEADGHDEALVCADFELIIDDELRAMLEARDPHSKVLLVTDSCYSGTAYRGLQKHKRRYLPFARLPGGQRLTEKRAKKKPAPLPGVIHFAACSDSEYSCDAVFDGRPNGAFTYYLLQAAHKAGASHLTYGEWFSQTAKKLPSADYPQTPQCNATKASLEWSVFEKPAAAAAQALPAHAAPRVKAARRDE